ncbi:hypothetical protein [Streptomyces microflavus]|uniref:hypothetical protein n=1 Tax=Streptomyces microflavus TaxID=1919 RepID=UPI0019449A28|nr:hypothetical protein [Streptomyces microflavus]
MTPPISPPPAPMSAADREAHEAGSYVRRPAQVSQDSPTPPADPAARRRFLAQRQW